MTKGASHYGPRKDGSYLIRSRGNPGVSLLTREMIEPLLNMTMTSASKVIGVNHKTLARYARAFGLKFAPATKFFPKRPPRDDLAEKCETHTINDLADEYGVVQSTVYSWLADYGLECQKGKRRYPPRMDEWKEIRDSALWMRKPIGKPWGGAGWHSIGTLFAMRAGE